MQSSHSRRSIAYAAGVATLVCLPWAPGASASSGGQAYVGKPEIKAVACASGCERGGKVRNGGAVRLKGKKLSYASKVVFLGGRGRADDVAVTVDPSSDRTLKVKVPYNARSGPLSALASARVKSRPSKPIAIVAPPPPEPTGQLAQATGPSDAGAPRVETAVNRGTFYFDGAGGIVFTYRLDAPAAVVVELVRLSDGAVVQTWRNDSAPAGEVQTIRWDGRAGGAAQPDGRYAFRLVATGADGAVARSASDGEAERDAFELRGNIFPVRGTHDYGSSGAQFGAGRSGRSHQGQDVMARCGLRLVAARGGTVKAKKFHSAAGNYVVIDAQDSDFDYFYAHLEQPTPFKVGDRVHTGQQIGTVGATGNARGCHLHFELWAGPGWYSGGSPVDPLPHLRAWDAYS